MTSSIFDCNPQLQYRVIFGTLRGHTLENKKINKSNVKTN